MHSCFKEFAVPAVFVATPLPIDQPVGVIQGSPSSAPLKSPSETKSDPIGRDLLEMSFVDGGITAIIATIAARITRPNKKGKKKP